MYEHKFFATITKPIIYASLILSFLSWMRNDTEVELWAAKRRATLIVYLCAYLPRLSLKGTSDSCNGKRSARMREKRIKEEWEKLMLVYQSTVTSSFSWATTIVMFLLLNRAWSRMATINGVEIFMWTKWFCNELIMLRSDWNYLQFRINKIFC